MDWIFKSEIYDLESAMSAALPLSQASLGQE